MEFKDILFRKLPFSRSMLSLCENENTPIRGKRIAPYQKKFSVKPVYNGPVYSSHPVYYSHRTTSQNFQLPYIF